MKQWLFVLMAIVASLGAKSQKDFEGKVVYLMEADKDEKKPELTVWFAPNKLKISFKENEEPDRSYLVVRLDSGKVITINTNTQQYKIKQLKARQGNAFVSEKNSIMGYPTTSVLLESNSPGTGLGGILYMNDIVYDLADNLTFTVPDQYRTNPEVMMVYKNQIALGASMKMSTLFYGIDEEGSEKATKITAKAIVVTPMVLDAAEFEIPAGFTPQPKYDRNAVDTTAIAPAYDTAISVMADSAMAYPAPKKPTKKPAKKPASKKTGTKPTAYRKQ